MKVKDFAEVFSGYIEVCKMDMSGIESEGYKRFDAHLNDEPIHDLLWSLERCEFIFNRGLWAE